MEPQLVPSDQLTQINALDQGTMTIGQLLGPAISGVLIAIMVFRPTGLLGQQLAERA